MPQPRLTRAPFGALPDGTTVARWTLDSGTGVRAEVLEYGGVLHRLEVPDLSGRADSVVLGLADLAAYRADSAYLGALVGRYANRIAHGQFTLDGRAHQVPVNDRGHALHGGPDGFNRRVWRATPRPGPYAAALRLDLRSPDGDMGFPGTLDVTAVYTLDRHGTLRLELTSRTDRATPVNLTHHAYFHLGGPGRGDVLAHRLAVDADTYLPVNAEAIPLGEFATIAGTAFDFRSPRPVGECLDADDPQLLAAGGYDHCFVLTPPPAPGALRRAARLHEPRSGRRLEVWTTEPGLQVYSGNALDGSLRGPDGKRHERHAALCLETQQFPDAPNRPWYPDPVLRPGTSRRSTTEFRFPHLSAPRADR
ncbi:aldose epimerase family protein [Streptacidiphilus jiangxiensis]|uniref:Aldose 1-epimerase n=1 Tax=Streptacidiphilus jiangxiensis TaxID=235985 RepID=A0A1H7N3D2_STRJI|nr:aldose epimerase family protein [Streptacidiphilus jiangxiensis]SEL17377.1 aldose 1-epimerase [Streptacidiphilus jiangxiensis]